MNNTHYQAQLDAEEKLAAAIQKAAATHVILHIPTCKISMSNRFKNVEVGERTASYERVAQNDVSVNMGIFPGGIEAPLKACNAAHRALAALYKEDKAPLFVKPYSIEANPSKFTGMMLGARMSELVQLAAAARREADAAKAAFIDALPQMIRESRLHYSSAGGTVADSIPYPTVQDIEESYQFPDHDECWMPMPVDTPITSISFDAEFMQSLDLTKLGASSTNAAKSLKNTVQFVKASLLDKLEGLREKLKDCDDGKNVRFTAKVTEDLASGIRAIGESNYFDAPSMTQAGESLNKLLPLLKADLLQSLSDDRRRTVLRVISTQIDELESGDWTTTITTT